LRSLEERGNWEGDDVSVLSEARQRGVVTTCHVTVVSELTTHGVAQAWVASEYTSVLYTPHEFVFVCELDIGE
jgi:hypothetical protein